MDGNVGSKQQFVIQQTAVSPRNRPQPGVSCGQQEVKCTCHTLVGTDRYIFFFYPCDNCNCKFFSNSTELYSEANSDLHT